MTKEIIIDGCNVAECEFLEDGMCNAQRSCDGYTGAECKYDNENCYFKQLIRTRQINFELISKANAYDKLVILANDRLDIIDRLKQKNEKLKKQYNCYACGNCNGKEDYINLEKHHKGLRKQFDELVKRNNTLSLRIEEVEKENEKLKEKNTELLNLANNGSALLVAEKTKNEQYKQALEEIREIAKHWLNNDWSCYHCRNNMDEKLKEIIKLMRF